MKSSIDIYTLSCVKFLAVVSNSLEKTLVLGKIEGRRGQQRMRRLDCITDPMDMSLNKLREMVKNRKARRVAVHRATKTQTQLSD